MEPVYHSRPWVTNADIDAVSRVVASSMLGQGLRVRELEQRLAAWFNVRDGVAVGSGSAAMVLALHGLEIEAGDEVILPTYVCRSVLEAIITVGAKPFFCDVGPNWVVTLENVAPLVGPRTRAIIIPHIYGIFADAEAFRSFGVAIIEDFAQAVDAEGMREAKGDVAVLSFHPTKCFTAGEGGMALSANPEIVSRMRALRNGRDDGCGARLFSPMSDIAAGLALSQLDRYGLGLLRRKEIADHYRSAIEQVRPDAMNTDAFARSMFFRFPLRLSGGISRYQGAFERFDVQVRRGVDELLHRLVRVSDAEFPLAVSHFETTVSVPIYPALTNAQESRCLEAITNVLPYLSQLVKDLE